MLAPLNRESMRLGARRVAADAAGHRAQFDGRKCERLANREAREFFVAAACDRQPLGGVIE
jgi:hypothetical protein